MEPMTLSPLAGSPVSPQSHQMSGNTNFLPAFLMGESTTPVTPRTNTLSPNNARNLAFGWYYLLNLNGFFCDGIFVQIQGNNNNINSNNIIEI